jgi:hypothetical protein
MSLGSTTSDSSSSEGEIDDEDDADNHEEDFEPSVDDPSPPQPQEPEGPEDPEEPEYDPDDVVSPRETANDSQDSAQDMEIDEDDYNPTPAGSDDSIVDGLEEPVSEIIADDLAPELQVPTNGGPGGTLV